MKQIALVLLLIGCGTKAESPPAPGPTPLPPAKPLAVAVEPPVDAAPAPPPSVDAAEEDRAAAYANALAIAGSNDGDTEMRSKRPGTDLGAQIEAIDGPPVALGTTGGGRGSAPAAPLGRVMPREQRALDDTSLTGSAVLQKILSAYLAGVKRCHKQALAADPALKGTLALTLTVTEVGRASEVTAKAPTRDLSDCVSGLMANWVFAVPRSEAGDATTARFTLAFELTPE